MRVSELTLDVPDFLAERIRIVAAETESASSFYEKLRGLRGRDGEQVIFRLTQDRWNYNSQEDDVVISEMAFGDMEAISLHSWGGDYNTGVSWLNSNDAIRALAGQTRVANYSPQYWFRELVNQLWEACAGKQTSGLVLINWTQRSKLL